MTAEKKKYTVKIFGDTYHLVSDEPERRVMQTADMVDAMMKEFASGSGMNDSKKLAVLVALQFANQVVSLEAQHAEDELVVRRLVDSLDSTVL
ncbi:cell division protein ZapA [Candidatus Babeliales bacterium]|nr:cell division protein ZapA [Candidatus Babeliales bacterium]